MSRNILALTDLGGFIIGISVAVMLALAGYWVLAAGFFIGAIAFVLSLALQYGPPYSEGDGTLKALRWLALLAAALIVVGLVLGVLA